MRELIGALFCRPGQGRRHGIPSLALLLTLVLIVSAGCAATSFSQRPEVREFVDEMAQKHGFERDWLRELLSQAEIQPAIVRAISTPAEAKPWRRYRPIFVTPSRIRGGVQFWSENEKILTQASERFGVPAHMLVAIIGVETRYGGNIGRHRVLDALATLAFDYPRKSEFFRRELENFLLLAREEQLDPLVLLGSYAGAMGQPQFISSSYRRYAVDFDGDGKRDLWNSTADIVGSVANYLHRHGWKTGGPIASRATVEGDAYKAIAKSGLKPRLTIGELQAQGVRAREPLPAAAQAALLELETNDGAEHWLGMQNFYVVTRYNHSALYAMAVYQLGQEILAQRANDDS